MPRQFSRWLLFALCLTSALAGCRSPSRSPSDTAVSRDPRAGFPAENESWRAKAHFGRAVIHAMNDEVQAAAEEYLEAALADPADEWLVLEVSRRLIMARKAEDALRVLEAAQAQPGASGAVLARLAEVQTKMGKPEEAMETSRRAIRRDPSDLEGYRILFLIQLQQQASGPAFEILEQAERQKRTNAAFLTGLAELYLQLGSQVPAMRTNSNSRALSVLRRAEKAQPEDLISRLKLADGFYLLGDSTNAAAWYLKSLENTGELALAREHIHAKLAEIYLRSSDRGRAVEQLESVVRENPTNPQAHFYLGVIAQEQKEFKRAAECFEKTVDLNPGFEAAYYDLGLAQLASDQPARCLETMNAARAKFPPSYLMELLCGLAMSQLKDYPAALRYLTAAEVVANVTNPKVLTHIFYFQLGAAQERVRKYEEAAQNFEKALNLAPDFAEALNYLGYMWADLGIHLDRSLKLIERALKLEPENPAFLDSLGWVLFKLNRPLEALQQVERAVTLSEKPDATLYLHLGDIYLELGHHQEAREAYQKSLATEASDEVQRKLDQLPAATR